MTRKYVRKPNAKPPGKPRIPIRPVSKGLPPKEIILDQVIYWIGLQATAREIASSFHVSLSTLERAIYESFEESFDDLRERCHGTGKLSLRRFQFKQAEKNCSMAIWLGKQWLGQKDHDDTKNVPANDQNLNLILDLIKQNKALQERIDAIESKAASIVQPSDQTV